MLRLKQHTYFLLISTYFYVFLLISTYFYLFSTYVYLFSVVFLSDFLLFFSLVFLYVCDFLPLKSAVSCFIAIVFRALECVIVSNMDRKPKQRQKTLRIRMYQEYQDVSGCIGYDFW